MSRRRTGAIAIGVGAATAVALSLAGAKTPVVIGSAAALGVAGGVAASRKGGGKSADEYLKSGKSKLENKDFYGAIAEFNKVLEIDSANDEAYFKRGNSKFELGEYDAAIEDYTKSIECNPQYAKAYANRGIAKSNLENFSGCLDDLSKAIKIEPNVIKFHQGRKSANIILGNLDEAIDDYSRIIQLDPQNTDGYKGRGKLKLDLGDFKSALEDFDKAIDISPNEADLYNLRGNAKSDLGDYQGKISDWQRALEIDREENNDLYQKIDSAAFLIKHEESCDVDKSRDYKQIPPTKQLVGEELLVKVKELGDGSKSELVRLCGYVSTNKDGEERLNFTAFYEALLEAKGGTVSSPEPDSKTESLAQEEQSISHDEKSKRFDMLKQRLIEEGIDDDDLDRVLSELKAIGITEVETFECQKDYHYETHHQFLVSEFKNKIREDGDADSEMDPELEDCVDWDKVDAYFTKDGWRSIQMDDWGYTYFYING